MNKIFVFSDQWQQAVADRRVSGEPPKAAVLRAAQNVCHRPGRCDCP